MKNFERHYVGDTTPEWQKGILLPKRIEKIKIENAEKVLKDAMTYILSSSEKELVWREQYAQIAEWLADNKRKGLFLSGDVGCGKSLIARYVIPAIISSRKNVKIPVFEYYELNPNVDEIIGNNETYGKKRFVLDDIGAESPYNQFGNVRNVFSDIMDVVEKDARLVIATTNLNRQQLLEKYGARTIDRIISTCKWVEFKGKSMR